MLPLSFPPKAPPLRSISERQAERIAFSRESWNADFALMEGMQTVQLACWQGSWGTADAECLGQEKNSRWEIEDEIQRGTANPLSTP